METPKIILEKKARKRRMKDEYKLSFKTNNDNYSKELSYEEYSNIMEIGKFKSINYDLDSSAKMDSSGNARFSKKEATILSEGLKDILKDIVSVECSKRTEREIKYVDLFLQKQLENTNKLIELTEKANTKKYFIEIDITYDYDWGATAFLALNDISEKNITDLLRMEFVEIIDNYGESGCWTTINSIRENIKDKFSRISKEQFIKNYNHSLEIDCRAKYLFD